MTESQLVEVTNRSDRPVYVSCHAFEGDVPTAPGQQIAGWLQPDKTFRFFVDHEAPAHVAAGPPVDTTIHQRP